MDSATHRAKMFTLANDRRRQGLPSWSETIDLRDVFHSADIPVREKIKVIVSRIEATSWYQNVDKAGGEQATFGSLGLLDCVGTLRDLVSDDNMDMDPDEIATEFDYVWDTVYDLADYARVWIGTV